MKNKILQFLRTYYDDLLNRFLFISGLILFVISMITGNIVWDLLFAVTIFLYVYRALSGNHQRRRIENNKYIRFKKMVFHRFQAFQKNRRDQHNKYFVCAKCTQIIRVPRGKGRLEIKCPICQNRFERRS